MRWRWFTARYELNLKISFRLVLIKKYVDLNFRRFDKKKNGQSKLTGFFMSGAMLLFDHEPQQGLDTKTE